MKITQTNNKSIAGSARVLSAAPAGAGNGAARSAAVEASDQSQISNLSTYLAAAMSGSPTLVAKLSALGTAVASGQYKVDSSVLSEGIIQHSLLFSGAW
jgi:anti-sigma28 factor (negative regulator of flagellin synthesis)